jgi:predicted AAA+ superfamily ATPase
MIRRLLKPLPEKSFFLFGARGTGKTTFLQQYFAGRRTLWIDLLDPEQEDRLSRQPEELSQRLTAENNAPEWVVIDEVQKIPRLLDVVHLEIERHKTKFALTGSSARKLKRGAANLLAGRAFVYHLHPFTSVELGSAFRLEDALRFGTMPGLQALESEGEKAAFLRAYTHTYLKEEVWAEHLIRKLDPFRKFLEVAAQSNGEIVNCANIARDIGADDKTVTTYFQILEDTHLGVLLEVHHQSVRKRQSQSPKFYFFDPGTVRALCGTLTVELRPNTYEFGRAFEHFVIMEIIRLCQYRQNDYRFSYLRTKDGAEIDLIVERPGKKAAVIEIKSTERVDERDTGPLERLARDFPNSEPFVFSRDPVAKVIGAVRTVPWQEGLGLLGLP